MSIYNKGEWTKGNRPKLYSRFYAIRARCINPNCISYNRYGAKGIRCEWENYRQFEADMQESYLEHVAKHGEKDTQIDRLDSNGHYNKVNCRWATLKEQSNNRAAVKQITFKGESFTLTEWSKRLGINFFRLYDRHITRGWTFEKAITEPKRVNQYV